MKDKNQESGGSNQPEPQQWMTRYVCITVSIVPADPSREFGKITTKDEVTVHLEDGDDPLDVILANAPLVINRIAPFTAAFKEPLLMLEFEYCRLPDDGDCISTNISVGATDVAEGDAMPVFRDMANKLKDAFMKALGGAS